MRATSKRTGTTTMTSSNNVWAAIIIVAALSTPAKAADPTPQQLVEPDAAHSAAVGSLDTYRQFAPPQFQRRLSGPGAAPIDLASPMKDYTIGLIPLQQWDGKDPGTLLEPSGQYVYSIVLGGTPQATVTVSKKNGQWQADEFGEGGDTAARVQAQQSLAAHTPGGVSNEFQVRIPAMSVTFVGYLDSGVLFLTPLDSRNDLDLVADKTEPGSLILSRLQTFAKKINPNVPN
jgi:hypothetical protein